MGNSYWSRTYGGFAKGPEPLHGEEKKKFIRDWLEMQKLFKPFMPKTPEGSKNVRN